MGFGHIFVASPQSSVLEALDAHMASLGFERVGMTRDEHPSRMREIHETRLRLFWISPLLGRWTGIFEFRYYDNALRKRWGYSDEELSPALSKTLGAEVYRLEVIDQAGVWLYARHVAGEEKAWKIYEDQPGPRSLDPAHPRYELNRIIEREGFRNVGLCYESIPGPMVKRIQAIPQKSEGIEGFEGFVHRAYRHPRPEPLPTESQEARKPGSSEAGKPEGR